MAPFERRVRAAGADLRFRHRVDGLTVTGGAVDGVTGVVLAPDGCARGQSSNRDEAGSFELRAGAVIVTSGGIGGNHALVRRHWPHDRLGAPPAFMLSGVPDYVDGELQQTVHAAGARLINPDRMWHYTEGIRNWDPIWPAHGIRILPGPSSLWLSPTGERLPYPNIPGADTLGTLRFITSRGWPYTWFVLNRAIVKKEFALSGSEQNPDLTGKSIRLVLKRVGRAVQAPVQAFLDRGADLVVRPTLAELIEGMKELAAASGGPAVDAAAVERAVRDRDAQLRNRAGKDPQLAVARMARRVVTERLFRVATPAPILDPADGPLIAVRLNILTRKSLGGLETDLDARVLGANGEPIPGLYAAGEVAGFGGGGMHGYRALEGTFLGGCLFRGRLAGGGASRRV
jgi:predicted oxidoreductase